MKGAIRRAIVRAAESPTGWWRFASPCAHHVAITVDDVPKLLDGVERAAERGCWAVGFVSYEAAPGLDEALVTRRPDADPLASFSLFTEAEPYDPCSSPAASARVQEMRPGMDAETHRASVETIRAAIAAGETYQVNLTFPVTGRVDGDAEALFAQLAPRSAAAHAAFLDLDERQILSLSPELFFELDGPRITMRPMKGTRRRGRYLEEDSRLADQLAASAKDRAENLMIVDMVRNDLGKVAAPGSVEVERLCDVARYPTVWQMTSTVSATTEASLPALFAALFPCASVTGAPKSRAMRWIERLEPGSRGVYCGAIGWVSPHVERRRARFSVAIRTATIERPVGLLRYGVGGGIVWDSEPAAEYDECLAKAAALEDSGEPFGLIETMRWSPGRGLRRLERHLSRMAASALYWGIAFDSTVARARLEAVVATLRARAHRVRVELRPDGAIEAFASPLAAEPRILRAVLAPAPVNSRSPLLFHKTTNRSIYEAAATAARAAGADDAILWNERGELTEGTRANLFVKLRGQWVTPSLECGLLPGVLRGRWLARGSAIEGVLSRSALRDAESVLMLSALRGARVVRVQE